MSDEHSTLRVWAGAYVLGALEPAERSRFERHLGGCGECRDEVASMASLPALLAGASADSLGRDDAAADDLARRASGLVRDDYERQRAGRRRWKSGALGAVAAALLLFGVLAVDVVRGDDSPVGTALQLQPESNVSGTVHVEERAWGVQISVEVAGLDDRPEYQLWAIDDEGVWTAAGTWAWTAGGNAVLTGSTSTPFGDLEQVVITSVDRSDVLVSAMATP